MEEIPKEWGAQALDHNELAAALGGTGIVSGCAASDGTNSMEVDVSSGTALVDGSKISVSAQTVTLSSSNGDYPRKDVVYIDSTGSAAVAKGTAEQAEPSNVTGRKTYRPAPEDLSATAAVVVAEVWVGAGVADIGAGDISDRRSIPSVPNSFVQALGNISEADAFSGYPLSLTGDTDADANGTDLVDGTTTIWDATNGVVPQAQLAGPAASLSAYPLVQGTDNDSDLAIGYVEAATANTAPYTETVTTGFEPRFVEFYANLHQAAFGTRYDSGANTGGGANGLSWSIGYATGSTVGAQLVSSVSDNSDNTNGHSTYAGDGEVVYLIETSTNGTTIDGYVRANVSSINTDGFTLEWTANYEAAPVLYRAYR